jgi:hypothetical protein
MEEVFIHLRSEDLIGTHVQFRSMAQFRDEIEFLQFSRLISTYVVVLDVPLFGWHFLASLARSFTRHSALNHENLQ